MLEADIKETVLIRRLADFLRKLLPQSTPQKTPKHHPKIEHRPKFETLDIEGMPTTQPRSAIATQMEFPSTGTMGEMSASYETLKRRISNSGNDETTDDNDDGVRGFYEIASPYLKNMRYLDEQYGIRRYGSTLMIGNSDVITDEKGDITIRGNRFRGTKGLWGLLSRKNVNRDVIMNSDLKPYKHILLMTNADLVGNEPGGDIQISRGSKFTKLISKLFPQSKRRAAFRQRWVQY